MTVFLDINKLTLGSLEQQCNVVLFLVTLGVLQQNYILKHPQGLLVLPYTESSLEDEGYRT